MPWDLSDAKRHTKKASSPKSKRMWAHISNKALAGGSSEASAIKQANAVVARRKKK